MAKTNRIEAELSSVTGVRQRKEEPEQQYLLRLVNSAADIPDSAFEKLSVQTQQWYNTAVDAINEQREIPSFFEKAAEATEKLDGAQADEPAASGGGKKEKTEQKKPEKKKEKKKKEKEEEEEDGSKQSKKSKIDSMVEAACLGDCEKMTPADLLSKLKLNETDSGTAARVLYYVRKVTQYLKRAGKI